MARIPKSLAKQPFGHSLAMGKAVLKVALMVIAAVATAWVVLYLMVWLFSDG